MQMANAYEQIQHKILWKKGKHVMAELLNCVQVKTYKHSKIKDLNMPVTEGRKRVWTANVELHKPRINKALRTKFYND